MLIHNTKLIKKICGELEKILSFRKFGILEYVSLIFKRVEKNGTSIAMLINSEKLFNNIKIKTKSN